jgi:hypothetical protein
MHPYERLGAFYLGRLIDPATGETRPDLLLYDSRDLTTHAVIVGMTGSGKTGLGITLLEEAALDGIPALVIDPKGDLGNLLLTFPELAPSDFRPWIEPGEAARQGRSVDDEAAAVAASWRAGLAAWDEAPERIQRFKEAAEVAIYTPGSAAGLPLALLGSLAPPPAPAADPDAERERIEGIASSLLALIGIEADPLQSREHILLSNLIASAWGAGRALDLAGLVREIQRPPIARLGALDLESFYPARERAQLATRLNALLAAPSSQVWLQGDPPDPARLLWTPAGKPRIAIISIAHLDDAQRMFTVTLLLNEVVSWMRAQAGTASLRAILYMDEMFGYLPPVANPPAKKPLLTLFKQARAFGLGVVAATQNPVDLDYKALSNAGTWFLGRLQTERDKARVLDGLSGAQAGAALDRAALDKLLSGLQSRRFLMQNAHEDEPVLFETRWALSYLRGPLTREQIRRLMASAAATALAAAAPAEPATPAAAVTPAALPEEARPAVPAAIPELFLSAGEGPYRPYLLGEAQLHYVSTKPSLDHWEKVALVAPLADPLPADLWSSAQNLAPHAVLAEEPAAGSGFGPLPAALGTPKNLAIWGRALGQYLYQHHPLGLQSALALATVSAPGETEGAFRGRLVQRAREARDEALAEVRAKFAPRIERLRNQLARAEDKQAREAAQYESRKLDAAISLGATLAGALFGRKLASTRTLGRATTAARGVERAARERAEGAQAEENRAELSTQLTQLEAELQAELAKIAAGPDPAAIALEHYPVRARKADTVIGRVALLWVAGELPSPTKAAG